MGNAQKRGVTTTGLREQRDLTPATPLSDFRTGGFASPPRGGFANATGVTVTPRRRHKQTSPECDTKFRGVQFFRTLSRTASEQAKISARLQSGDNERTF